MHRGSSAAAPSGRRTAIVDAIGTSQAVAGSGVTDSGLKVAQRRTQARRGQNAELTDSGEQWGGKLNAQDQGQRKRGRPLSDSGAKERMYHEVKDASLAHLVKIDLHSELFNFWVDEATLRYLERLDGKLLLVTNTVCVRPSHLDARRRQAGVLQEAVDQRCGSSSSMRLAGCVGSRSSTSLKYA
jgi:hypothetical protein